MVSHVGTVWCLFHKQCLRFPGLLPLMWVIQRNIYTLRQWRAMGVHVWTVVLPTLSALIEDLTLVFFCRSLLKVIYNQEGSVFREDVSHFIVGRQKILSPYSLEQHDHWFFSFNPFFSSSILEFNYVCSDNFVLILFTSIPYESLFSCSGRLLLNSLMFRSGFFWSLYIDTVYKGTTEDVTAKRGGEVLSYTYIYIYILELYAQNSFHWC